MKLTDYWQIKIFELIIFSPACSILKCSNKSTTQHNIFVRIYDHKAAQHWRLLQSNTVIKTWSLLFKMLDMQYFLHTLYWHLKRSFTHVHRFFVASSTFSCHMFALLGLTRRNWSSTWWSLVMHRLRDQLRSGRIWPIKGKQPHFPPLTCS